jgi:antitoxin ParD1/3/4
MPTMNVSLTEEMVRFVEEEVAGGDYVSASEVVRDALRVLKHDRDVEDVKLELLREAVDLGLREADEGKFSDLSISEIADEVLRKERR